MVSPAKHLKNFGGVNFNWNEVKSAKVVNGKDGKKTYFIEFKTGVKAEYPLQEDSSYAEMNSRELTMWQSLDYDTETVISNITEAKITGSQNDDHIIAKHTNNSTINVANDNNDDHVDIVEQNNSLDRSDNNTIILDSNDTATNTLRAYNKHNKKTKTIKKEVQGPGIENRF